MKLLFKMKPQGAFYAGTDLSASSFPFPHSDTMFQSLLWAWALLWGKAEKESLLQKESTPFWISSIFPALGETYFLPRPFAMKIRSSEKHKNHAKNTKAISWISASVYQQWLAQKEIVSLGDYFAEPSIYFSPSDLGTFRDLCPTRTLWRSDEGRIRNRVDLYGATTAYPAQQIYYTENLNLYMVVEMSEPYQEKIEACMRLLADEGIGGRRSIGCGAFTYEKPVALPQSLKFLDEPIDGACVLLSLGLPHPADIQKGLLDKARYEVLERQGWSKDKEGKTRHHKKVRLLEEGTCLASPMTVKQSFVDTTPLSTPDEHCYHYCYPFMVAAPGGLL